MAASTARPGCHMGPLPTTLRQSSVSALRRRPSTIATLVPGPVCIFEPKGARGYEWSGSARPGIGFDDEADAADHVVSAPSVMVFLPEAAGPHDPVRTTVRRGPSSVRRTSSIDTTRPDGLAGDSVVVARARDLRTGPDLVGSIVAETELRARIDGASRQLVEIAATPTTPGLDQLLGFLVGPGFRAKVNELLPEEQQAGTLLHLLLDDLPGATLVSGYALQRAGTFRRPRDAQSGGGRDLPDLARMMAAQDDLCAGWAHEGSMMVSIRQTGEIPVPTGPPAPVLESIDDPLAWHPMEPLPPHGMRRRRRLDVTAPAGTDDRYGIDAHFRDSHVDELRAESVVHEYSVAGTVDRDGVRVEDIEARAQVLPWMECPGALASAGRLSGMPVAELRNYVRREFKGTSTCTHLNDTLRSLGDVDVLVGELSGTIGSD